MSVVIFPIYALCHATLCAWAFTLWKSQRAPGAALVALVCAALTYDNIILSIGASIGIGPLLESLSWPRFVMHAFLTPLLLIVASKAAQAAGLRWAQGPNWNRFIWLLVPMMILVGVYEGLIGLELVPACFDDTLRYTSNLHPTQLCYEGQQPVAGNGPPIPSIVATLLTLIVGIGLWRQLGWPWMALGATIMFFAAAIPSSLLGMAPGNGGEVLLLASLVYSVARFAGDTAPSAELAAAIK
ncbi:hypothetical protein KUV95_13060 [Microbulbifer agarilyticus]|uniref:hypothetical protein n=1 Tax=Microbulbifer agarilyticus TaxID=260552 RepID=UPI001C988F9E|nr:hypothetical protein [Microbulbifer agarilyticus]MBY6212481.1 hypothetical protein [Microbulbifer agarilyticus]